MSRTKKGKKSPGQEYWGKRPISMSCVTNGTKDKRDGIQRERAILKRCTQAQPTEPEWDENEYIEPCEDPTCPVCH